MHRPHAGIFAVLVMLILSGCYISVRDDNGWDDGEDNWRQRQQRNQRMVEHLDLGRSLDSVTSELGAPDLTESFVREDRQFRVLFYRTRRVHDDGRTTRDETTPLVFVDGELVGWGEAAIEHALP